MKEKNEGMYAPENWRDFYLWWPAKGPHFSRAYFMKEYSEEDVDRFSLTNAEDIKDIIEKQGKLRDEAKLAGVAVG